MISVESPLFKDIYHFIFSRLPQIGDRIPTEQELSVHFGITRYKLREVLNLMVQLGMLERAPRRGTIVKMVDKDLLLNQLTYQFYLTSFDEAEFTEARVLIELATLPSVLYRITPQHRVEMGTFISMMRKYANQPLEADKYACQFHLTLLKITGNRVIQLFSEFLKTYFALTTKYLESVESDYFLKTADMFDTLMYAIDHKDLVSAQESLEAIITGHPRQNMLKQMAQTT